MTICRVCSSMKKLPAIVENPEKERTDIIIKMCQDDPEYRYNRTLAVYFPYVIENDPEAVEDYKNRLASSAQ